VSKVAGYLLIWVIAFVAIGALDALWHLVVFKKKYEQGLDPLLPRQSTDKQSMRGIPAIVAQIVVVTAYVALVAIIVSLGGGMDAAALTGTIAGILAISVYGLVNRGLIKDWNKTITLLEVIWGPIIGTAAGVLIYWLISLFIG